MSNPGPNSWQDLAADHLSGASEIYLHAVNVLKTSLADPSEASQFLSKWPSSLRRLLEAQPTMAPLYNLVNRIALILEKSDLGDEEWRSRILALLQDESSRAAAIEEAVAQHTAGVIAEWPRVMVHSYSGTVAASLERALASGAKVEAFVSEARPACEGRRMAERLAKAGIRVNFFVDDARKLFLPKVDLVLLGADRVSEEVFINKIGSASLAIQAASHKVPVLVTAQSHKFWPSRLPIGSEAEHDAKAVWPESPANVFPRNFYFEEIAINLAMGVMTENGLMGDEEIRSHFQKYSIAGFWTDNQ